MITKIIISILLCIAPMFCHSQEWKNINNALYSFSVPDYMIPQETSRGDPKGINPLKGTITDKNGKQVQYYGLWWHTPINNHEDFKRNIGFRIESYQHKEITIDVVKYLQLGWYPKKPNDEAWICEQKEIWPTKGQQRLMIVTYSFSISVITGKEKIQTNHYYLFMKKGSIVHCVCADIDTQYAEKHPEKVKDIKRMLDSFKAK